MSRDETAGLRAAQLRLGRLPGYVRRPDPARRSGEKGHTYKKGWEVRFTARSEAEIAEIRDLVVAAGFAPARPFFKGHQLIQPVYGMAAVQAYLAARQAAEEHAERIALGRRRRAAGAHAGAAHAGASHAGGAHTGTTHAGGGHPGTTHAGGGHPGTTHAGGGHPGTTHAGGGHPADGHGAGGHPTCTAGGPGGSGGLNGSGGLGGPGSLGTHRCEREDTTAAAAQLARRRAVEGFPAQVERGSTVGDRFSPSEVRTGS
ncbi:hypothetical protein ABT247_07405 [Kitasatospora sp. NPDC001539]|uniref:hypothetical protein n=1 Tax=Kitasatospora sp. NPDC001539 TaxID=3154384 RepID=UPI003317EF22